MGVRRKRRRLYRGSGGNGFDGGGPFKIVSRRSEQAVDMYKRHTRARRNFGGVVIRHPSDVKVRVHYKVWCGRELWCC